MASLYATTDFDEPRPRVIAPVAAAAAAEGDEPSAADLDLLVQYAREVSRWRLLTPAEEHELARRKAEGDEAAARRLIESNLRLVMWIARGYAAAGIPMLDLIQEGNLALMHAVGKFDHRQGCRFSTYATWWIRQAMAKTIGYQKRAIRLPEWVVDQSRRVTRARSELVQSLNRDPTTAEVAAEVDLPEERVVALLELEDDAVSLDAPAPDGQTLADALPDLAARRPDEEAVERQRPAEVERALMRLTPRLRQVLVLRFGLDGEPPRTLREAGEVLGLTAERVRQLETQALGDLGRAAPALALYLEAS
jgi:RNA polymerase primary sigma factor